MKKVIISLAFLTLIISCNKDDYSGFRGTHSNFLELSFNGVIYKQQGLIIFTPADIGLVDPNGLSRNCTSHLTNFDYGKDSEDKDLMITMTIPAYSNMMHDSLIGKKFVLENSGCGDNYKGGHIFGLDLRIKLYSKSYFSRFDNDLSKYYNKITKIKYVGSYYDNPLMDVYEVLGEFKIDVVDQSVIPELIHKIIDGKYGVTVVTHKE